MKKKIILASTSPRRQQILAEAGVAFEVVASSYEEDMTLPMRPAELAKYLSKGKADAVAKEYPDAVIVAADTFIAFEDRVLGKPHTAARAKETLSMLSGKPHSVITGFTIIDTTSGRVISEAVESKVFFKELSEQDIDDYIATGEPLDKAGAYAIQGIGKGLVDHIEGDYNNIVGLPVSAVVERLNSLIAED